MTNFHSKRQQGFTLLETLVAFAILVLVLAVTFKIYASGSRSSRLAHEYAEAVIIAQSKLAEFQTESINVEEAKQEGKYHWQLERSEMGSGDLGMSEDYQRSFIAYDVSMTVTWNSAGKQRKVHLDTVQLVSRK